MILFIDDEPRRVASFVEYIQEEKRELKNINNLSEADEFFLDNIDNIDLIILDIMMPAQNFCNNDDNEAAGINGGFLLYKKIRKNCPSIPLIIFTNVTDETIHKEINRDSFSVFMHKRRTLPFELVNKINELLINVSS